MSKPIAFPPWAADMRPQYFACWPQQGRPVPKDTAPAAAAGEEIKYLPVFIPVYPMQDYPGLPCQPLPLCPAGTSGAAAAGGHAACPCCRPAPAGNNAYILFLIFLLIMLGTRKEQILAAIRKLLR